MITSIKLESYQIPGFYSLLEEYGVKTLAPRSNFEVYYGELNGSHICITINGQVEHDPDTRLQEMVDLAYMELVETPEDQIETDEIRTYMILAHPSRPESLSYQINHLNIWLDTNQYQHALDLLRDDEEVYEVEPNYEYETFRFEKNQQHISFHGNGKVIAESGYSIFAPYMTVAIETRLPYQEFDMILGQDEVGNGERIGPLVIGAVGGTPKEIADLQLIGVKDSKMVPRGLTLPMTQWIRDTSSIHRARKLDPIEFNSITKDEKIGVADILTRLHHTTIDDIKGKLLQMKDIPSKIVYVIDQFDKYQQFEELKDDKRLDIEVHYSPHAEQQSVAVAAASLFAKAAQIRWVMLHEKVHQIQLKRKNLTIIKQHRRAPYLLKQI